MEIIMNSIKIYHEDTYRFSDESVILMAGRDERGEFIVLDRTIFYPGGGGQPCDQGYFSVEGLEIPIKSVRLCEDQIRHYTDNECHHLTGKKVSLHIDVDKRLLHAKLHTAGHLISHIVEENYSGYKAIKGHHFPGECYVEFASNNTGSKELDLNALNSKIQVVLCENQSVEITHINSQDLAVFCPDLPYTIPHVEQLRLIKLGRWGYQPCDGTHVKALS